VTTNERPNTGAVDRAHAGKVHHEVPVADAQQLLELLLEGLSGTAANQRLSW
jgi:hypothetical protein